MFEKISRFRLSEAVEAVAESSDPPVFDFGMACSGRLQLLTLRIARQQAARFIANPLLVVLQ